MLIDLVFLYDEEKTLIGDVFENENERIEEERRGKSTRVDCGVYVYIYIYRALEQEKRTDSPWEVDNLFPPFEQPPFSIWTKRHRKLIRA